MREPATIQEAFKIKTPKETVTQSDIYDVIDDFNDLLYEYDVYKWKFPAKYYYRLPSFDCIAKCSYSGRIYIFTYDDYLNIVKGYNKLLEIYLEMPESLSECLEAEQLEQEQFEREQEQFEREQEQFEREQAEVELELEQDLRKLKQLEQEQNVRALKLKQLEFEFEREQFEDKIRSIIWFILLVGLFLIAVILSIVYFFI